MTIYKYFVYGGKFAGKTLVLNSSLMGYAVIDNILYREIWQPSAEHKQDGAVECCGVFDRDFWRFE